MSQEIDELKLDLEELKSLLTQVKRRKNKTFLNNQIATLENKINVCMHFSHIMTVES